MPLPEIGPADPAAVAVHFIAALGAHYFADYLGQTDRQALDKGLPGPKGRRACTGHVRTLALAHLLASCALLSLTGIGLEAVPAALGIALHSATHWWADRRRTLRGLVLACDPLLGKSGYYDSSPQAAGHIDQAWHLVWLAPTALIMAAPAGTALLLCAAGAAVLAAAHAASRRALAAEAVSAL